MLAGEGDETFHLNAEDEARLLAAIAQADRGETVSASELLRDLHQLPVRIAASAALAIKEAGKWWAANRPKAPRAFVEEIERAF